LPCWGVRGPAGTAARGADAKSSKRRALALRQVVSRLRWAPETAPIYAKEHSTGHFHRGKSQSAPNRKLLEAYLAWAEDRQGDGGLGCWAWEQHSSDLALCVSSAGTAAVRRLLTLQKTWPAPRGAHRQGRISLEPGPPVRMGLACCFRCDVGIPGPGRDTATALIFGWRRLEVSGCH